MTRSGRVGSETNDGADSLPTHMISSLTMSRYRKHDKHGEEEEEEVKIDYYKAIVVPQFKESEFQVRQMVR